MSSTKVKIKVGASEDIISSTNTEEYTRSLAENLDAQIKDFLQVHPTASTMTATVLIALGYLEEIERANVSADHMRSQVQEYLEDANRYRTDAELAKATLRTVINEKELLVNELAKANRDHN